MGEREGISSCELVLGYEEGVEVMRGFDDENLVLRAPAIAVCYDNSVWESTRPSRGECDVMCWDVMPWVPGSFDLKGNLTTVWDSRRVCVMGQDC